MLKVIDVIEIGEEMKMDRLGRVTIPISLRKKYKFAIGEKITVIPTQEGILLRKYNPDVSRQINDKYCLEQEIENVVKKYISKREQEEREAEKNG
jgi:bifunctional DNA-binding transcriptional regulator/antitoxin component of YhaV-PrlF toxin-antitoxin module